MREAKQKKSVGGAISPPPTAGDTPGFYLLLNCVGQSILKLGRQETWSRYHLSSALSFQPHFPGWVPLTSGLQFFRCWGFRMPKLTAKERCSLFAYLLGKDDTYLFEKSSHPEPQDPHLECLGCHIENATCY